MARRPQETRILAVATPLETDALLLDSISGREELGRLFSYELDLVSDDPAIDFNKLLGENITVRVQLSADTARYINGFVSRFSSAGLKRGLRAYSATIVPWCWFLTRTSDCRIYQNISVVDVIKSVFEKHGFSDYELRLDATYRQWEYLVQYRETDFNFISRLMEQEGIYYYFLHENGKHTLVLADSVFSHDPLEGGPIPFFPPQEAEAARGPHVWDWQVEKQVQPGALALTDYNFEKPSASLLVRAVKSRQHAASAFEMFDYPGEYPEFGDGEQYARIRIDEHQTSHETIRASGNVRRMSCGCTFELADEHAYLNEADTQRGYLLVGLGIDISEPEDFDTGGSSAEAFSVSLLAIPSDQSFRPARTTPKPMVQGVQTAQVVGPAGEEIHTDEYGRIKVLFHWDRHGKADENASCWVRVAQSISGKQWGALYTPRIGHEVIIEFLEGDPDRPLVTGSVYNANNKPPYVPKEMATISTLKTRSSPGGGRSNFNEIKLEDKKDSEMFYIQAEKDRQLLVKNNNSETIGNDESVSIGHDRKKDIANNETTTVGVDRTETVGSNETISIGANRTEQVAATESVTIGVNRALTVGGNQTESIGGTRTLTIALADAESIGLAKALSIGGAFNIAVGGAMLEETGAYRLMAVGGDMKVEVGGDKDHSVSGKHVMKAKEITLDAATKITLQCSGSKIVMSPGMITISAPMVKINC